MNQHQALANLHKVVQICNSGIDLKNFRRDNTVLNKGNLNTNSSILNPINNEPTTALVPASKEGNLAAQNLNKSSTRQFDESALQF